MTLQLALRSLLARPVRSAVLAAGFGLGIAVMASLLGVGEVILAQARSPHLRGGGDVLVVGATGDVQNARFAMTHLLRVDDDGKPTVRTISPSQRETLYLVDGSEVVTVYARGGIPSLERAIGDPEIEAQPGWVDAVADRAWTEPTPNSLLRSLDRFHPVPDAPRWRESWAEWLYFNGRSEDARFYLSFLAGPPDADGMHPTGVRLQLERGGRTESFVAGANLDADALRRAPDLTVGKNQLRLEGTDYVIRLQLQQQGPDGRALAGGVELRGELVLSAEPGRAMPPAVLRGAQGWLSGYVVPVLSGELNGELRVDGETLRFAGADGYHDHNWGFWRGVTWQWGHVFGDDRSYVWGLVVPPDDAADASRVPVVFVVLGPDGPLGYSSAEIRESGDPARAPERIQVVARGAAFDIELDLDVSEAVESMAGGPWASDGATSRFIQMRTLGRVRGQIGGEPVDRAVQGSAETFRPGDAGALR